MIAVFLVVAVLLAADIGGRAIGDWLFEREERRRQPTEDGGREMQ